MSSDIQNISWPGWETVGLIGRGSFGAVYEIERKVFNDTEKAALKVISIPQNSGDIEEMYSDGYDEESITSTFQSHLESIVAEYSLMRKLNGSANIVNCDDVRYVQHDDGIGWDIFIKMELLTPLSKAVLTDISEETVIKIAKDMCGALELCKKHSIVHRDIKPQNIFMSEHGDYKLGDFGIAKTVEKTMGGTKIGTYKYMAPEVYNNQPYGCGADIYSLGLVLYWLLNERRMPFMPLPPEKLKAGVEESSRTRRLSGEPLPEPAHGSKELKQIVLKACAYDTKERYQSATEMLQDIEKAFGTPVHPEPAPLIPEPPLPPEPPVSPVEDEPKSKLDWRKLMPFAVGAAAVIVIVLMLLHSCGGEKNGDAGQATTAAQTTATESGTTPPEQLEWSEWSDELPDYVTEEDYEIKEREVWRSITVVDTTSSTTQKTMDGWEMYEEVPADTLGAWSQWSPDKEGDKADREYQQKQCYSFCNKEITTASTPTLSGWTLYNTTYTLGDYPNTYKSSDEQPKEIEGREIVPKTIWKYKDIQTTTSTSKTLDGWTRDESKGIIQNWGAAQTTTTKPQTGDGLRITATTQTNWGWYHYCCAYYENGWCMDSIQYVENYKVTHPHYHTTNTSQMLPAAEFRDQGNQTAYGGNGWSISPRCACNFYYWFRNPSADVYTYTYQTCIPEYHFYKWPAEWTESEEEQTEIPGKRMVEKDTVYYYRDKEQVPVYHFWRYTGSWSAWDPTPQTKTDTRDVQQKLCYRYRDKLTETTYYFRKWSNWEDAEWTEEEITESDTVKVEKKTQYQFKLKTPK